MKRRTPRIIRAVLGSAMAVMLQVGSAAAQSSLPVKNVRSRSRPVIDQETYSRVLDIVFPRDEPAPGGTLWAVVLRFRPNSSPESQIVIRRGADKAEVISYTPVGGSIYAKLNEALERSSRRDAAELAKIIEVSRKEVSVSHAQIKLWYSSLFDSITGTAEALSESLKRADDIGAESLVLHGAFYDFWYAQGLNTMSFNLYDVDIDDARTDAEFKLVRWMDAVRRGVAELKHQRVSRASSTTRASAPRPTPPGRSAAWKTAGRPGANFFSYRSLL